MRSARSIIVRTIALALTTLTALAAPALAGGTTTPLYGVTGDGGTMSETLFRISTDDASMTLVAPLGNGDDGESLAFNPLDRQLYHWSGGNSFITPSIMETVDPASGATTNVPWDSLVATPGLFEEGQGATYHRPTGAFFVASPSDLFSVTPDGVVTLLGPTDHRARGLAILDNVLYSLNNNSGGTILRTLNPANGATVTSVPVTLPGIVLDNGIALATDPATNTLWGVLKATFVNRGPVAQVRYLVTIDPATGVATQVGILPDRVSAIAFVPPPDSPLAGVSGNGGANPESLFLVETTNAVLTLMTPLGNGTDGESISFNPSDRQLYHWSGRGTDPALAIMESIDPGTLSVTDIPWDGAHGSSPALSEEILGATFDPFTDTFFAGDLNMFFYSVTPSGTVTTLGPMDHVAKGFAIVSGVLYSIDKSNGTGASLRTINPADGSTLTSTPITLAGVTISNGLALALDPATGVLWGVLKATGNVRHLVTINPNTGVASPIGVLGERIASIAFVPPDPCPGDFNNDGAVNLDDLQILLFNFGQPGTVLDGDANGDGLVNLDDLQLLLFNFGVIC